MTRAQAITLYERACETHKRADWRVACHALHAALTGAAPVLATPRPAAPQMTLCQYLASVGGISADESDAIAMDAELWHKGRPFQRKLVREGGMCLDVAAGRALDAGYFDHKTLGETDNYHQIGPVELLEAIRRELARVPDMEPEPEPDDVDAYWQSVDAEAQRWAA